MKINVELDICDIFGEDAKEYIKDEIIDKLTREVGSSMYYGDLRKYFEKEAKEIMDKKVDKFEKIIKKILGE